jgi:hypothetical protein
LFRDSLVAELSIQCLFAEKHWNVDFSVVTKFGKILTFKSMFNADVEEKNQLPLVVLF